MDHLEAYRSSYYYIFRFSVILLLSYPGWHLGIIPLMVSKGKLFKNHLEACKVPPSNIICPEVLKTKRVGPSMQADLMRECGTWACFLRVEGLGFRDLGFVGFRGLGFRVT